MVSPPAGKGREEHPPPQRAEGRHPNPHTDNCRGAPTSAWKPFVCRPNQASGKETSLLKENFLLERERYGAEYSPCRQDYRPCGTKTTFFWRVNTPNDVLLESRPPSPIENRSLELFPKPPWPQGPTGANRGP